jgi:hypothetical protein
MLDGLRGVGKTVLLNEADVMACEQGWISSGVLDDIYLRVVRVGDSLHRLGIDLELPHAALVHSQGEGTQCRTRYQHCGDLYVATGAGGLRRAFGAGS